MNTQKLALAILRLRGTVGEVIDFNAPEIEAIRADLRDANDLLKVLANIVGGKPIDKAFGSPGDWGHDTEIGKALAGRV